MLAKVSCALLALAVLLCGLPAPASALSDAEYKSLLNDTDFQAADRMLGKVWKDVYGSRQGAAKKQLLQEQRAWLKSGRDRKLRDSSPKALPGWKPAP